MVKKLFKAVDLNQHFSMELVVKLHDKDMNNLTYSSTIKRVNRKCVLT